MWTIAGFGIPGYDLDMYPGDHFPHHFHLSCAEFDIRILYRRSREEGAIRYTVVWRTGTRKNWKPLTADDEAILLELINRFFNQLEAE